MRLAMLTSGTERPRSHSETAWRVTPRASASICCVYPAFSRASLSVITAAFTPHAGNEILHLHLSKEILLCQENLALLRKLRLRKSMFSGGAERARTADLVNAIHASDAIRSRLEAHVVYCVCIMGPRGAHRRQTNAPACAGSLPFCLLT